MKNKILIVFFMIITFGIFLIPKTFAYYDASVLDNVNVVSAIEHYSGSSSAWVIRIDTSSYNTTDNFYICMQIFNKNNLNTPLTSTMFSNFYYRNVGSTTNQNLTSYTSNSNFGYRTPLLTLSQFDYYYVSMASGNLITDYVFNVCISKSQNSCWIGRFVPNTYYNIGALNDRGVFQYFKTYLALDATSWSNATDTSNYMIGNDYIGLNNYSNQVYNTNSTNTSYYYNLRVDFNGISLKFLPNLKIKYLTCTGITINNVYYTYDNAKSAFSWLYRNIYYYSDNATLYINDNSIEGFENTIINSMDFRFCNYQDIGTTYYDSNLGVRGYIYNCSISSLSPNSYVAYNNGYENGYNNGKGIGYDNGYIDGQNSNMTGFDNLMFSVADVPMHIISSMLNFNILGFNMLGFFMGIITLVLFVHILRKFKE